MHEYNMNGPGEFTETFTSRLLADMGSGFCTAIDLPAPSYLKIVSTSSADTAAVTVEDSALKAIFSGESGTVLLNILVVPTHGQYFTLCGHRDDSGNPLVFIYRVNAAVLTYPVIPLAIFQIIDIVTGATVTSVATSTAAKIATFNWITASSANTTVSATLPSDDYFAVTPSVGTSGFSMVSTLGTNVVVSAAILPGYTSAKVFSGIAAVRKPITVGTVHLYAVDLVSGSEILIASYAPSETNPCYRRYAITGTEATESIRVLCKRHYLQCYQNTDEVIPGNLGALKHGILALNYENHGDLDRANMSWGLALTLLQGGLREARGGALITAKKLGLGVGRVRSYM